MKNDRSPTPAVVTFVDEHFRTILVSIVIVGVAASAAVWSWPRGSEPQAESSSLPSYPVEQVARGRDIFQASCASCHGSEGRGNPSAGVPALDGSMHAWHHPDSQIAGFLRDGVGDMPAVGSDWDDNEIRDVLAYVKQWWQPDQLAWQTNASRQNP